MATGKDAGDENLSAEESSAKQQGTQPSRSDVKEHRGDEQSDQISGQTQKGAHNQEAKGRNPQSNEESQS